MASLAFNALSLSPKPVALLPTRYQSQNYAFAVQRLPPSSSARFQLNAVPQAHKVLSPRGRGFKTLWCTSASKNGDHEIESFAEKPHTEVASAMPVGMEFYAAINKRDPKALSEIMSDKCLFHDLAFPKGFEGKEAVLQYIKDLMEALGKDMQFKIDGISEGDDLTVAVLWHLEWQGRKFPFSKGCGIFYCEKEGDKFLIRSNLINTTVAAGRKFINKVHSIVSYAASPEFLEKNIRSRPDLDALGAQGDIGWYCCREILWANGYQMPQTVRAMPAPKFNAAGVITSCGATFMWGDGRLATYHVSFLSHATMNLVVEGTRGTIHVEDLCIPFEETKASFKFISDMKPKPLFLGWENRPEEHEVITEVPQEVAMIEELSSIVKNIRDGEGKIDPFWPSVTRKTQVLVNAVMESIHGNFDIVKIT